MGVAEQGQVEGYGSFSTAVVDGCQLGQGKWYYEVAVLTAGLVQIGWADHSFQLSCDSTDGVGDDEHSYAYDGSRQMKWNGKSSVYGVYWNAGDVVGCRLDLTTAYADITFYLNGDTLGNAFMVPRPADGGSFFLPVVSMEQDEKLLWNIGQVHS